MRIGITGANGFIGQHLAARLEKHSQVQLTRFQRQSGAVPQAKDYKNFVTGQDLIYHLGAVNRGSDEELLRSNVLATANLLTAIKQFALPTTRLVFASSTQVYRLTGARKKLSERCSVEAETVYGISKRVVEDLIRLSGLPHLILRLSNVYGPGCRPDYNSVIATFCHRAVRGESLKINGDGSQGRDFIYIGDVVEAFILAGFSNKKSGIFNVGSGKITSLKQVIGKIDKAGIPIKADYHPELEPGGNSYCCDASRFEKKFNWKASTSLLKGIRKTLSPLENITSQQIS
jgi:nucleoside-diphosphate-sugar epimerase